MRIFSHEVWSVGPKRPTVRIAQFGVSFQGGGTLRVAQERGEREKKKAQMQPQWGVDFTNNSTIFQNIRARLYE
jgi:hypothetical protein